MKWVIKAYEISKQKRFLGYLTNDDLIPCVDRDSFKDFDLTAVETWPSKEDAEAAVSSAYRRLGWTRLVDLFVKSIDSDG